MNSTALGTTNKTENDIMFKSNAHEKFYYEKLKEIRYQDEYHIYYELTLYMDLWNNEIVAHALSSKRGDRMTYLSGLDALVELKKQYPQYTMILHSDQGAVYASKAFNELRHNSIHVKSWNTNR